MARRSRFSDVTYIIANCFLLPAGTARIFILVSFISIPPMSIFTIFIKKIVKQ